MDINDLDKNKKHYIDINELIKELKKEKGIIYIKGSHSMNMDLIVKALLTKKL